MCDRICHSLLLRNHVSMVETHRLSGLDRYRMERRDKMQAATVPMEYDDAYEYDGSTTIEVTRRYSGRVVWKDWLIFDSIEEARTYYDEAH